MTRKLLFGRDRVAISDTGCKKPTQDNKGLLRRIRLDLLDGMAQFIDTVGQSTSRTDSGEPGQAPGPAQEPEALLGLGGRGSGRSIGVGATSRALELLLSQGTCGAKELGSRRKRPARQRRQLHGGGGRGHLGADRQRTSNHCRAVVAPEPKGRGNGGGGESGEWVGKRRVRGKEVIQRN